MTLPSTVRARSPYALGWEAAKANALPAFILQALMVALLLAYYLSPQAAGALDRLAAYKEAHGLAFVIVAAILAGALLPEIFVIVFFQRGRIRRVNGRNLCFTVPVWAIDGVAVDLLYRTLAHWLGSRLSVSVVALKICVDQFGYNPIFAAPFEVLTYEWKNSGISLAPLRAVLKWPHYRDKIIPTLLATWAVWFPLVAVIYSLPLPLQFPLFTIALTFWVLLLTYMTNRFAENHPESAVALAAAVPSSATP